MCGIEGREEPIWRTVIPFFVAGATSKSAEMNWLDEVASTSTTPPFSWPLALIVIGSE